MRTISFTNHKGGVSKSTSCMSIGAELARRNYRTLLVDLDAQTDLTSSLLDTVPERSVYESFTTGENLPIVEINENLHLVPASMNLAGIELMMGNHQGKETVMRKLLQRLEGYDFVLIDCPPSLGLVTINALAASDSVIVPMSAEALPTLGLRMIDEVIGSVQERLNPSLRLVGILITRWLNRNLNRMVVDSIRERYGDLVFSTKIRENISVAEAPLAHLDIGSYDPESNGAHDYSVMTTELLRRLDMKPKKKR